MILRTVFQLILVLGVYAPASASDAPAENQSFVDWVWKDQFKPMFEQSGNPNSLKILAGGVTVTALSFQYDNDVHDREIMDRTVPNGTSKYGALLGSGFPGISIAVAQLYFDRTNGLMHARSIALTSATHFTTAMIVQRERPNKTNKLAFPSGHTSSSFATAASLGYAYGPWVGVPAYLLAGFVGASRISDDAHWLSDTIAGAALGIYWASVSANVKEVSQIGFYPVLTEDGALLSMTYEF